MAFQGLNLNTAYTFKSYPYIQQDIENINKVFSSYGLKVNDVKESSQVVRYIVNLPLDISIIGKIQRAKKAIEGTLSAALQADNISYFQEENSLVIERKGSFNVIPFGKLYTNNFHDNTSMTSVVLGQDLNGKLIYTDIAKAPHILIAGTTGSGKSETIHSIIASLLMHNTFCKRNGSEQITSTIIDVIDMKGTEYTKYKDTSVNIISNENEAFSLLSSLCDSMEQRYKVFSENECEDIDEYISKGNRLSRKVCIIDEFADLILKNRGVEEYVVRLAQKARACGIHLVIGTQSPRRDVVTGLIKANIPFKIALNTSNSMESRIILDETGAEKLFGKGDMLIKKGGDKPIRAQGCFVSDSDKTNIASIASKAYKEPTIKESEAPEEKASPNRVPADWLDKYDSHKKKPGLFQGIKNIMNASPCTSSRAYWTIFHK